MGERQTPEGDLGLCSAAIADRIEIAVVIPTYNERENIGELVRRLERSLNGLAWEAVFVDDDSPDGTAEAIRMRALSDRRIRLVHRIGRRGLSSACIEGMLATPAPFVAVMDADLQHDETILPKMLARVRDERLDLVIATRNADGGDMGQMAGERVLLSRIGKGISRTVCNCAPTDPMSGFFLVDRNFFLEVVSRLQSGGFKILVDMLASSRRRVHFAEVGYSFRERQHGESKLDINAKIEYLFLIVNKLVGGALPTRFVVFALVGTAGVVVHLAWLALLYRALRRGFAASQLSATFVAMIGNFFLNNAITYRDRSLRGARMMLGLISFCIACSFGAWANVTFARSLLQSGVPWYLAGLAGTLLSAVWNFSVSSLFTWQMPQLRSESDSLEPMDTALSQEAQPPA